jgi:CHAT domain-containing protein
LADFNGDTPLKDSVSVDSQIALLHLKLNEPVKALAAAQTSIDLSLKSQSPDLIAQAYTALSECYRALGKTAEAEQSLRQAIEATERQRTQIVGNEQSFELFFAKHVTPYTALVSLLVDQHRNDEALAIAEKAKARVLTDVLRGRRIDAGKLMNKRERNQEQALRGKLSELNRSVTIAELRAFSDPDNNEQLKAKQAQARNDYEDFQTTLTLAHPQLRLAAGLAATIEITQVGDLLAAGTDALLEYVVVDDHVYLFGLTKEITNARPAKTTLRVYPLTIKPKELAAAIQQFRDSLANRDFDFKRQARALYDQLLGPARTQLHNRANLVIVPDRELWALPFQALLTDSDHYLIERAAISYAPSLTALREMRQAKRGLHAVAQRSLLAMGNPTLPAGAVAQQAQYHGENLASLPDAEREVASLGEIYGRDSNVLTADRATETTWKNQAGDYRILHLATHGLANPTQPLYSHLLLAAGGDGEDGLLEAWEIMQLRLHAEMVVLSACETAGGRLSGGEGMIGLSWAFFVAGVPTTVVSQWNVDSARSAELMIEFHRQFKRHYAMSTNRRANAKALALQAATLKLLRREDTRHPFYWAGFVMVGDGN